MRTRRHPTGVSVIEVMIALGIAVIIVISVGSLIISTHSLDTEASNQLQAVGFAKQWLEVVDVKRNDFFGCACGSSPACQLSLQRQTAGYLSCWTQDIGSAGNSGPFHIDPVVGLQPSADAPAVGFTRSMKIENQLRDVTTGELGSGPEDPNTKRIIVTVEWQRAGTTRKVELSEIVTAWKNF
jgi:hypothetical protein